MSGILDHVQYGCGLSAPVGWRNFDASPRLRLERLPLPSRLMGRRLPLFPANVEYGDIVRGLPVADSSCAAVYCSHVLEHLSLAGFRAALRNTHRLLRPGGTFRLVLPDLEQSAKTYLADPEPEAALRFMRETFLGIECRPADLKGMITAWFGNSQHLWMWDYKSIEPELVEAGFNGIRRARFGDATDARFFEVEDRSRWDGCLGVECRRPVP